MFFAVHGGGCSEVDLDLERYSFKRMRDVIGDIPMASSLDAHGNLSHDMINLSDGLYGIKTVPHIDCEEAGYMAAKNLIRQIRGEVNPRMYLKRIPLLIPATTGRTVSGPGKEIMEFAAECVKKYNLIDATFFFGFSAADCPCSSCSVLAVADGYVPKKEAEEIAEFVWQRRYDFSEPSLSVEEAMDAALLSVKDGYVVINEASDNPGGGAPGDGTHLLREMIKRNIPGTIMGALTDSVAVKYLSIVTADPPGQCPINLKLYQYKNIERPILPLEEADSI